MEEHYGDQDKQGDMRLQRSLIFRAVNAAVPLIGACRSRRRGHLLRLKGHYRQGNSKLAVHGSSRAHCGNGLFPI